MIRTQKILIIPSIFLISFFSYSQNASIDIFKVKRVSFEMVKVVGDTFSRGCAPQIEECMPDQIGVHRVVVHDFYIGKYEVTQELWEAVMGDNPSYYDYNSARAMRKFNFDAPSAIKFTPQHPVMEHSNETSSAKYVVANSSLNG